MYVHHHTDSSLISIIEFHWLTMLPAEAIFSNLEGPDVICATTCRVDMELQARKNHGTPRPRKGANSTAMFGGKTKSHLYCAILPQAQVQIVRLSLDFLHQIYIYIFIYIYIALLAAPSTCFPFISISSYFSCTSKHNCFSSYGVETWQML